MSVKEKLEEFWSVRRSLQPNTRTFRPFRGWEQGAGKHLVFLFRVNSSEISSDIAEVQADLSRDEAFVPFPPDYLHITVKAWGFLEDNKVASEDIIHEELECVIPQFQAKLSTSKVFDVKLERVNVFPSVVFAEVHDDVRFAELNKKLLEIPRIEAKWSDHPNYIPHIAIGTFKEGVAVQPLIKRLEGHRNRSFGTITVENIELVIAHWRDTKFPVFEPLSRVELR
ncbi:MAG: 2'-5' RNA ligase family protein [Methanobacteriota archaeon]